MFETLPKSWKLLKISEVAEINPRRPSELLKLPDDYEVTFVPMASVCEHKGEIAEPIIKNFPDVKKGFTYFAEDDVLFAKITPCMQNGKAAIARNLKNNLGFGSTEFHVLRAGENILPEWIYFFVRQQSFRDEAKNNFRGSAGQQRVPADFLADYGIPIPPIEEQRRIVGRIKECLSRVDEIKLLREESRTEAKSLEETIFGDFLEDAQRDGCEVVNLGDVLTKAQYGTSAKATADGKGFPVLRMGNIKSGHFDFSDLKYMELSDAELEKYRLNVGDILINRTNSLELVGKSAVFQKEEGDWVFASYLVRLVVDSSKAIPEFVNASINSRIGRAYVYATARRAIGMVNINAKEIAKMPLPLPSLEKQAQIVSQIKEARTASQSLLEELEIKEIESLSNSILRKAFAGEL